MLPSSSALLVLLPFSFLLLLKVDSFLAQDDSNLTPSIARRQALFLIVWVFSPQRWEGARNRGGVQFPLRPLGGAGAALCPELGAGGAWLTSGVPSAIEDPGAQPQTAEASPGLGF